MLPLSARLLVHYLCPALLLALSQLHVFVAAETLEVTLFNSSFTVSDDFTLPLPVVFNGSVSAPSTNSVPVYSFPGVSFDVPQRPEAETSVAAIPVLSPGQSYTGVLFTITVPAVSPYNITYLEEQYPDLYSGWFELNCATTNDLRPPFGGGCDIA